MATCQYNLAVSTNLRYTLGIINAIQGLAAFLGNALVFFIVIKNKKLHTRSNACLLSLAASDLLVGAIVEPMHVIQFFSEDYRADCVFNKIRRYLSTVCMGASISSIAVVSYDRYIHLTRTIHYLDYMPLKKVIILLVICWSIPILVPLLRLTSEAVYSACILVYVILVFSLIITCYFVIIKMVRNREKAMQARSINRSNALAMRGHIKAAKAIIILIACLMLTIAPVSVYHGVTALYSLTSGPFSISSHTKEICYAVLMTIGMANSTANPAIYYFRMPDFRASFKKLLPCLKKKPIRRSAKFYVDDKAESMTMESSQ